MLKPNNPAASPNERYQGRPFLILLENYVLWSIGHLNEKNIKALEGMSETLRTAYHADGNWTQIIEKVMKLPGNMPELIKKSWTQNLLAITEKNLKLDPILFAKLFVDQIFVSNGDGNAPSP